MIKNLLIMCGCLMFGTSLLVHGMQPPNADEAQKRLDIITKEVQELTGSLEDMAPVLAGLVRHQNQSPFLKGSYKTLPRRFRGIWEPYAQQTEVTDPQVHNKRSKLVIISCVIGISSIIMLFLTKKLYDKIKAYRAKKALSV